MGKAPDGNVLTTVQDEHNILPSKGLYKTPRFIHFFRLLVCRDSLFVLNAFSKGLFNL